MMGTSSTRFTTRSTDKKKLRRHAPELFLFPLDLCGLTRGAPVTALRLRLIGFASVGFAIGRTKLGLMTAEMELIVGRIADRPAAHPIIDRENRREISIRQGDRIFLDNRRQGCRGMNRCLAGNGAARPLRTRRSSPPGQTQAMHLPNHGVAGDAPQHPRNLARGEPLVPKCL